MRAVAALLALSSAQALALTQPSHAIVGAIYIEGAEPALTIARRWLPPMP